MCLLMCECVYGFLSYLSPYKRRNQYRLNFIMTCWINIKAALIQLRFAAIANILEGAVARIQV